MRQDSSGVEKFFIDWSNMQIREKHGECVTPEPERKIGNIPQTIAKNTVCKKFKVFPDTWQGFTHFFAQFLRNTLDFTLKQHFSVEEAPFHQKYISSCQDSTLLFIRHMGSQNRAACWLPTYLKGNTHFICWTDFVTCCLFRYCKFSSVGKQTPGVKLKLAEKKPDDCSKSEGGEVLGYGRNIFMGYLNRENDTKVLQ